MTELSMCQLSFLFSIYFELTQIVRKCSIDMKHVFRMSKAVKTKMRFESKKASISMQKFRRIEARIFFPAQRGYNLDIDPISLVNINISNHHAISLDGHMSRLTLVRRKNT